MSYFRRTSCRACGSAKIPVFLDFGPMPLANAFLHSTRELADERTYPLQVCLCEDCGLVQIPDVVDPQTLFRQGPYLTGVSAEMSEHFRGLARHAVERVGLEPGDVVLEIGSNDGTLLEHFRREGVQVLGIEPARDGALAARKKDIETIERFFDASFAAELRDERGGFRAVIANNVLAHVERPTEFLAGCRVLVEGVGGAVVFEVPWLGDLVLGLQYDTIYHEHQSYFSVTALQRCLQEAGLAIDHVERVSVHGGSLRVWSSARKGSRAHSRVAADWLETERGMGLSSLERLARFAGEVEENRRALVALLESLKQDGASLAACGAPAKSTTLLNHARLGTGILEYAVDKNPLKVGSWTPGMHLPVLAPVALEERRPDFALLLAWNLEAEMRDQYAGWLSKGGRFILPVPRAEILS